MSAPSPTSAPARLPQRVATVTRNTNETQIVCSIGLDHTPGLDVQVIDIQTGIGFLDHVSPKSDIAGKSERSARALGKGKGRGGDWFVIGREGASSTATKSVGAAAWGHAGHAVTAYSG